jgi:hypothetical protein
MNKNINSHSKKSIIYVIIALILVVTSLFLLGEQTRDWSQYADQDLTLAYNALLVNEGYKQEYYDHPGFFTIRSLAILIKIKFLLGYSDIQTISDLNNNPSLFSGFTDIVSTGHFLSFISAGITVFFLYLYSRTILKSNLSAFYIALATLISGSVLSHFIHLRTEMIACLILYVAMYLLYRANAIKKEKEAVLFLCIALIFFNLSLLNKVQLILYIPFYVFWLIHLHLNDKSKNEKIYHEKDLQKKALYSILIAIVLFCVKAKGLSILFQFFYILILNGLVYFYTWLNGGNIYKNIIIFNRVNIISFIIVFGVFTLVYGYNGALFRMLHNPMQMLAFANNEIKESFGLQISIQKFISVIWIAIIFPIKEILIKLNSESFLFYLNITLLLILKKQSRLNKYNVIICLSFFYIISIISSFRYRTDSYVIFSEFFLIMALISQISIIKNKAFFCFAIFFVILLINYSEIKTRLFNTSNNIPYLCTNSYMSDWHKKLDIVKFNTECKKYVN